MFDYAFIIFGPRCEIVHVHVGQYPNGCAAKVAAFSLAESLGYVIDGYDLEVYSISDQRSLLFLVF